MTNIKPDRKACLIEKSMCTQNKSTILHCSRKPFESQPRDASQDAVHKIVCMTVRRCAAGIVLHVRTYTFKGFWTAVRNGIFDLGTHVLIYQFFYQKTHTKNKGCTTTAHACTTPDQTLNLNLIQDWIGLGVGMDAWREQNNPAV